MEEIIEHIWYEIRNSGYEKKLIAGIVLTGGGAQLKHIKQLTEYMTGMDVRIGYPNEHLAPGCPEQMASPMYATGIGLVIQGFKRYEQETIKQSKEHTPTQPKEKEKAAEPAPKVEQPRMEQPKGPRRQGGFLDRIQKWFEDTTE